MKDPIRVEGEILPMPHGYVIFLGLPQGMPAQTGPLRQSFSFSFIKLGLDIF